jgi:hypothetical protein
MVKQGVCLRCAKTTDWSAQDGWVFHVIAKHWRCSVCKCATEPERYLEPRIVDKLKREEASRLLDQ